MSAHGSWVTARAPASIGNIGVGFDLLGHSIEGPGDEADVCLIDEPMVRIDSIEPQTGISPDDVAKLPLEAIKNTAGLALMAMRNEYDLPHGFAIRLRKGIALGSGLGGSASSCVAALVAANAQLEKPLDLQQIYRLAMIGESASTGSQHGDNVGPMIFGGVVLTTMDQAMMLPDAGVYVTVVHPHMALETRKSRAALKKPYPLGQFVQQSQHLALFIMGLLKNDHELIRLGLHDVLVEPRRATLIPGFSQVKQAALDHHALGASISGGGPSVFGWFSSKDDAQAAGISMSTAFANAGLESDVYVSPVAGAKASIIG